MQSYDVVKSYDVIISGGGMVGATLGAALAQQLGDAARLLMVEKEPQGEAPPATFDARSLVLSRSTVRFLYQQGWWPRFCPLATPIERVSVRAERYFGGVDFTAVEAQAPALGYVMSAQALGAQVWSVVQEQPTLSVCCGAQIVAAQPTRQGWRVEIQGSDGTVAAVDTRLLIVAEGAGSQRLQQLGIQTTVRPYHQMGGQMKAIQILY